MRIKRMGGLVVALLLGLWPVPLLAAPLAQATPAVTVSPSTVRPGETIQVKVTGFTAPNQVNGTLCFGVIGPGRNFELHKSPAFDLKIGEVTISATGTGQAAGQVPTQLASGSYRLVVGGCARQPDLAPLAALALTTLTVVAAAPTPTPAPVPTRMPSTGGAPEAALLVALALGASCLVGGSCLRKRA